MKHLYWWLVAVLLAGCGGRDLDPVALSETVTMSDAVSVTRLDAAKLERSESQQGDELEIGYASRSSQSRWRVGGEDLLSVTFYGDDSRFELFKRQFVDGEIRKTLPQVKQVELAPVNGLGQEGYAGLTDFGFGANASVLFQQGGLIVLMELKPEGKVNRSHADVNRLEAFARQVSSRLCALSYC